MKEREREEREGERERKERGYNDETKGKERVMRG